MRPLVEIKTFVERYQHHLSIGSFLVGFTIDTIILKRIDLLLSNALLITYLTVVLVVMLVLHGYASRTVSWQGTKHVLAWLPFVGQFAFGGMFSGFLIFYSQSGSLISSWPFLLIILALILSNEFLRSYQSRLTYQSALLFFCMFSFSIYALPIFLGYMGDSVFELSGLVSLVAFSGALFLLYFIDRRRVVRSLRSIVVATLAIYGLITSLYFANILPPIPLALKDIGIYHDLRRSGDGYAVAYERAAWHARLTGLTVHVVRGESLYAYSSIFAPTRLSTQVVHRWEYHDGEGWMTVSTIPFGILGGRDGGYRGYSELIPHAEGEWRVSVETTRGQLIGREAFSVRFVSSTPVTEPRILD